MDSEERPQRDNLLASLLTLLTSEPVDTKHREHLLKYQPGDLGIVPAPKTEPSTRETTHLPPIDRHHSLIQHQT